MTIVKDKVIEYSIQARQDIERIVADCMEQDAEQAERAGLGFAEALQKACEYIARFPGIGSSRYEHLVQLPGLKSWYVHDYPHLVFYFERPEKIYVLRVLHDQCSIPDSLTA